MTELSCYRQRLCAFLPWMTVAICLIVPQIAHASWKLGTEASLCFRGGSTGSSASECELQRAVLNEMAKTPSEIKPRSFPSDIEGAARDFSPDQGTEAWNFLAGLASSPTFRNDYWHKQPLLIRASDTGGWVQGAFTVERDLRLVGDSYITGHCTADILRNGTKTDTWEFRPLKDNPARKTTWKEVDEALNGGTIYFNTAGSLWPTLGALCRLTIAAFGLPANVNVYVTPPGVSLSVPPHTDRQDVLVLQTAGAKRWRVFAPPPRVKGKDALDRGKKGDVLTFEEMGEPLIDTVIRPGDFLYVPTGFPHTTDTCTAVGDVKDTVFDETSVHLTMGLDTNVWGLTFAHLRWSLLQRVGKNFRMDVEDDEAYWAAMETIPIGFLGGDRWQQCIESMQKNNKLDDGFRRKVIDRFKDVLRLLEPDRWLGEDLPSEQSMGEVVDYMVNVHLRELWQIQEDMFSNVDPHKEESMVKAFKCTQRQNAVMENFGGFSRSEAMRTSFAKRRMDQDQKLKEL